MTTHIHSLVLETLGRELRLPSRPREVLDLDTSPNLPLKADLAETYRRAVATRASEITRAVREAFSAEMDKYDWFDEAFVQQTIDSFVDDLDSAFLRWRGEYTQLEDELDEINRKMKREGHDAALNRRRAVIERKLENMREGKRGWYAYRYLGGEGFLPNYAFPRQSVVLSFYETEDELHRDPTIALNEYAPGNFVYYRGDRYEVTHARPRMKGLAPATEDLLICPTCEAAYLGEDAKRAACRCGQDLLGVHPRPGLALPDMFGMQRARITADEEERRRLGYAISPHYRPEKVNTYTVCVADRERFRLAYEHNAHLISINAGPRKRGEEGEPSGFALCGKCHRWLMSDKVALEHVDPKGKRPCSRHAGPGDLIRGLALYTRIQTDVLAFDVPLPESVSDERVEEFYTTLLHTWLQGTTVALNMGQRELDGFLTVDPCTGDRSRIILYETAEGGSGGLASLVEAPRLRQVVARAREILHEGDPKGGCQRACYECLLTFYNQLDHGLIDRRLVLPFMRSLDGLTIQPVQPTVMGPSFDELVAQCQSDLERDVLRAIQQRGLPLPDAAQKTVYEADEPITTVDFFYDPNVIVFVDGSPHYRDYVADADARKRKRLKARGYRVVVITPDDLDGALHELTRRLELPA